MAWDKWTLIKEQAGNPGCGMGTENACYALMKTGDGLECGRISKPDSIQIIGIKLGWRVNVDPKDNLAWCPFGMLDHSKVPPPR